MNDRENGYPRYYDSISQGPRPNPNRPLNNVQQNRSTVNHRSVHNGPQNRTINNNRPVRPQQRPVSQSAKKSNNVNVRKQNMKKYKKNKFSLKKAIAIGTVVAGLTTGIFFATHKKDKIQVPEQFVSTGITVEVDEKLEQSKGDFTLIKLNNWKKGISDNSLDNIDFCENNKVPYGIIIESDAKNDKEAKVDAAFVDAILDEKSLACPVYYDITGICNNLNPEQVSSITETFTKELSGSYNAGVCVNEDYLIKNDFDCEKLVVCNDYEINYSGDYNMCYFSETGEFYSNSEYKNSISYEETSNKDNLKGIDVSEYQGDIDWTKIKEQNVNFAILRFSSFYNYHDGASLNIDEKFYENVAACQALDISYGVYCFSTAETVAEAKLEAEKTIEALQRNGLEPGLPIYYDAETEFHKTNPEITAKLAKAFCAEMEKNGYRAGLYASYSLIKDMIYHDNSIKDMDKWVAWYQYNSVRNYEEVTQDHIPDLSDIGKYNAAQVTENGRIDGITANTVDVNWANESIGRIR